MADLWFSICICLVFRVRVSLDVNFHTHCRGSRLRHGVHRCPGSRVHGRGCWVSGSRGRGARSSGAACLVLDGYAAGHGFSVGISKATLGGWRWRWEWKRRWENIFRAKKRVRLKCLLPWGLESRTGAMFFRG